jgi:hypothetical protein
MFYKGARARELMAWLGKCGNESRAFRKLWVSLLFQDNLCVWEVLVHLPAYFLHKHKRSRFYMLLIREQWLGLES